MLNVDVINSKRGSRINFKKNTIYDCNISKNITRTKKNIVLESVGGICDGRYVRGIMGDFLLESVFQPQNFIEGVWTPLTGSAMTYLPPPGTRKVIYNYNWFMRWIDSYPIPSTRLFFDQNEVVYARSTEGMRYYEGHVNFEWIFNCNADSNNTNTGAVTEWTEPKTIQMEVLDYSADYEGRAHDTVYWNGGGDDVFMWPQMYIWAIS